MRSLLLPHLSAAVVVAFPFCLCAGNPDASYEYREYAVGDLRRPPPEFVPSLLLRVMSPSVEILALGKVANLLVTLPNLTHCHTW